MDLVEFHDILIKTAKEYYGDFLRDVVPRFMGQPITEEVVHDLLNPYFDLAQAKVPQQISEVLNEYFEQFIPRAVGLVGCNACMHKVRGESVLDKSLADDLLVAFVNYACFPTNRVLCTSDLNEAPLQT